MNERFASYSQTRYAQYEGGILMPAGDKIAESSHSPKIESTGFKPHRSSERAESKRASEPLFKPLEREEPQKPLIPFKEATSVINIISAVQDDKDVILSPKDVQNINAINLKYGDPQEAQKQRTVHNALIYSQEVIRNSHIEEPKIEDYKYEATEDGESGLGELALNHDKAIIRKVQSRDEETLTAEKLSKHLSVDEEVVSIAEDDKGPGTPAAGPSGEEEKPDDDQSNKLEPFLKTIDKFSSLDPSALSLDRVKQSLDDLVKTRDELYKRGLNYEDLGQIFDQQQQTLERLDRVRALYAGVFEEQLKRGKGVDLNHNQLIYYGLTSMPQINKLGLTDELKKDERKSDRLVAGLAEEQLEILRKFNTEEFDQLKKGKAKLDFMDSAKQKELYSALRDDQVDWFHEKLQSLPLRELDITEIGDNIDYREFVAAQSRMVREVAEYARGIVFFSENKYIFESGGGMKGLAQRASRVKIAFEAAFREVTGLSEAIVAIEDLNSREELESENIVTGADYQAIPGNDVFSELRKKWWKLSNEVTKDKFGKDHFEECSTGEEKVVLGEVIKKFNESEIELMKKAAIGRYVYKLNQDDGFEYMRPKTRIEIAIDETVLGDESWKVGGFINPNKAHLDEIREHLMLKAKDAIIDEVIDFDTLKFKEDYKQRNNNASSEEINFELKRVREHQIFLNQELLNNKAKNIETRARLAAFVGEWTWRMWGNSGRWGEQGGIEKGEGGGQGENEWFQIAGFQMYATQEAKGDSEVGRVMRKLAFGADTRGEYQERYVPGLAGGENLNTGMFDFTSTYSAFNPGERSDKPMHRMGFRRGTDDYFRRKGLLKSSETVEDRIGTIAKKRDAITAYFRDRDLLLGGDEYNKVLRESLTDDDKAFIEEINNVPIAALAGEKNLKNLLNIRKALRTNEGPTSPFDDLPDAITGDFPAANEARGLLVHHREGFFTKPHGGHINKMAEILEGRKRIWQRAKMVKDMTLTLLKFRTKFNNMDGGNNWTTEEIDTTLTDLKVAKVFNDRVKKQIEREIYKYVPNQLEKVIPLISNPGVHKFVYMYPKKAAIIVWDVVWGMIQDFIKRLPGQLGQSVSR